MYPPRIFHPVGPPAKAVLQALRAGGNPQVGRTCVLFKKHL